MITHQTWTRGGDTSQWMCFDGAPYLLNFPRKGLQLLATAEIRLQRKEVWVCRKYYSKALGLLLESPSLLPYKMRPSALSWFVRAPSACRMREWGSRKGERKAVANNSLEWPRKYQSLNQSGHDSASTLPTIKKSWWHLQRKPRVLELEFAYGIYGKREPGK